MRNFLLLTILLCCNYQLTYAQIINDDFQGTGTISTWAPDDCGMDINFTNPFQQGINTSTKVLKYDDIGGQYANVRFDVGSNFDLSTKNNFSIKIYVPSSGITGVSPNQVSLKLQDGTLGQPWVTQSEIIKPIVLDQWQTITFDFLNDTYVNLDGNSPPPTQRTDFNRVLLQVNGENNNDHVIAYIDDIDYYTPNVVNTVYTLVWSDDFDVDGAIDATKWHHQTQLPAGGNWYNSEVQHYTDRIDNAEVDNGILSIVAKAENYTNQGYTKNYTSARLNSKFAFTYGKVEVRAKLPTGVGTWPAIWMLGKNINEDGAYWDIQGHGTTNWPACGEIDIMEHWGHNQNYVSSAMHTPSSSGGTINHGNQYISTVSTAFHIYTLEWTSEKMIFSVDGVEHYTYNPATKDASTWPFNAEQYLLLNVAIQPSAVGAGFVQSAMEIDYVRVYQETVVTPVELTTFYGSSVAEGTQLHWETASELNNSGFQVQYSLDATNWGTIGFVEGRGTTFESQEYSFLHETSKTNHVVYYRLKQVDFDGKFEYSKVIQITSNSINDIKIYPNPTDGLVQIQGVNNAIIRVMDNTGRMLKQQVMTNETLDISDLPKGNYILVINSNESTVVKKIVKQ